MNNTKFHTFFKKIPVFWLLFCLYLLVGLIFVFMGKVWTDESWYFGGSWLIAKGMIPYKDFFVIHNPLFFYFYAIPQYFFGPSMIVGRLTSLVLMMLTFILAWRVSFQFGGKTAALITSGLLVTNLFSIYHFTTFHYRALETFLIVLFFTVLFEDIKNSIKYPLTTFILALVIGIRYPIGLISGLLILYIIYIVYNNLKDKRIIISSVSVAAITLAMIMLPFIIIAKEQFVFSTITYMFGSEKFYMEFGLTGKDSIFMNLFNYYVGYMAAFKVFNATIIIIFSLLIYSAMRILLKQTKFKDMIIRNQNLVFLSIFITFNELFFLLARGSAVSHRTFIFPIAAIIAGAGVSKIIKGIKDNKSHLLVYCFVIVLIMSTPLLQDRELMPALKWEYSDLHYYYEAGHKVANYTNSGDKILTFTPIIALQANRELINQNVMELYDYFPIVDTKKAQKYNLMNTEMLFDYIATQKVKAVVLTDKRFFSNSGASLILDKDRIELLRVLDENYYLAEEIPYPSEIGRGNVYIYIQRQFNQTK